jgi:hypothetical protein
MVPGDIKAKCSHSTLPWSGHELSAPANTVLLSPTTLIVLSCEKILLISLSKHAK